MKKAQDHVLQQRRTRYTKYDRESLRKPSERKEYCKKDQRRVGRRGENCKKKKKKNKSKGGKDWTNEEISILIDMLKEKPCLWDVFDKEYTKRDFKEIAYTDIASSLDTNIESVKAKTNGVRAQLGREVAKINKSKSGQSTDKLYASSWIHYDRFFLACNQIIKK